MFIEKEKKIKKVLQIFRHILNEVLCQYNLENIYDNDNKHSQFAWQISYYKLTLYWPNCEGPILANIV